MRAGEDIVWTFIEMWLWFFVMAGFWVMADMVAAAPSVPGEPILQAFFISLSGLAFMVGLIRLITRVLGWFGFRGLFGYDKDAGVPLALLVVLLVVMALLLT